MFNEIAERYGEPHRHYHGLNHLVRLFETLEPVRGQLADPVRIDLTVWFHDIIYDPLRQDNEARSAEFAQKRLAAIGVGSDLTGRVAQLIRATSEHREGGSDRDDALFLDADFSILGAQRDTFDRYVADVRKEYRRVPKAEFDAARAKFLRAALAGDRVFLTTYFEQKYGDQARENMARELAEIE
ncbi:metal-dependent phosphohydrolase [Hyphobacterium sp.]|uniref:HD domain-containing protein n=1 Tax=Hyphobacterium sp. TaxID=2004662 RepID=UPI003B52979C